MPALIPPRSSLARREEPLCARCGHHEQRHYLGELRGGSSGLRTDGGCTELVSSRERCPCNGFRPLSEGPQGEQGKLERRGP